MSSGGKNAAVPPENQESTRASPSERARSVLSAGIIPVWRASGGDWRFLLLRAYDYWDFPKGIVEPGEEPWTGALRELREETGIQEARPRWGSDFFETSPYSRGKVARYYLAEVAGPSGQAPEIRLEPNPAHGHVEHHEFSWLKREEAVAHLVPRVRAALEWACRKIGRSEGT